MFGHNSSPHSRLCVKAWCLRGRCVVKTHTHVLSAQNRREAQTHRAVTTRTWHMCCYSQQVAVSDRCDWLVTVSLLTALTDWRSCPVAVVLKVCRCAVWFNVAPHSRGKNRRRYWQVYTSDAKTSTMAGLFFKSSTCVGAFVWMCCVRLRQWRWYGRTESRVSVGIAPDSEGRKINTVKMNTRHSPSHRHQGEWVPHIYRTREKDKKKKEKRKKNNPKIINTIDFIP